jgi:tetratricopeptide (TPR) repeat protein
LIILVNIAVLAGIALGAWWLTGFDKTAGGESKRGHHLTRAIRSIAIIFLSATFIWFVESPGGGYGGMPILIILPMCIALVLRSSLSELFAHGFLGMLDPELHGTREFDPKKSRRYQDAIAHLIHNGRRDEAIKLCEELKLSGEVDIVTLQNTLEFLGVKQDRALIKPLLEAGRLRQQKKFAEAEQRLKSLLLKNPADNGAAIMLMRLYAEDLHQTDRAHEVLRALEKQPHAPADHLEFARRSIGEWGRPQPQPIPSPAIPPKAESVDDFLAQGSFGTAIEMLEEQIKAQPADFELQLKLAEVHAVHCRNLLRAEKIVRQIELAAKFSPQQIATAQAKFKEWHAR